LSVFDRAAAFWALSQESTCEIARHYQVSRRFLTLTLAVLALPPRASAPAIGPVILIIFLAFVNLFLQFLDPAWPEPLTLAPFASETARLGWSAEGPFSFLSSVERSGVALGDKALQCGFTLASQPSAHSRPDFHWRRKFAAGDASVERCWINWSRAAE
jgi:hypothetical protein